MSAPKTRVAPWEDFVLRVIAIWKLSHAVFFTAVGFGLLKLRHYNIVEFLNNNLIIPYHINPESHFVDWLLDHAQQWAPWMSLAGYGAFVYATLFAVEGVGLYLRKRWAEWLVVAATGTFIPFEVWALIERLHWWKFLLLFGNIAIVAYLVHRITLDARMKKKAQPGEKGDGADSALNGQTPGNRVSSSGAVSAKTR